MATPANNPRHRGGKRTPPFSLRLTEQERAHLVARSNGTPLSAFIKSQLFDEKPIRTRRSGSMIEDREAFAHALALLGKSELARSVASLAREAESGALAVDPETEAMLVICGQQIDHIRTMMLIALGLFSERFDDP